MSYSVSLEAMIGTNYVKYDVLNQLMHRAYEKSNANELNIFVDLYSIIKPLFSENMNFEMTSELELSADIVNLCGHYRYFYSRYLGARTNFFLIFGLNMPEQNRTTLCPGYNQSFYTKFQSNPRMRDIVSKNLRCLELLCKSLPDIHFCNIGDMEVASYMQYILNLTKVNDKSLHPNMENMILTKDILPMQLVSDGCVILRPKKHKGFDTSFTISHESFWDFFMCGLRDVKMPVLQQIPTFYFANLLAMTRVPERNMSSLKALPTAYKYLVKGIELGYLKMDGISYQQSTINQVLEMLGIQANYTEFDLRWKAVSSRFYADNIIPLIPELKNLNMNYIHDPNGVKEIMSKYYQRSPIDLDKLNN